MAIEDIFNDDELSDGELVPQVDPEIAHADGHNNKVQKYKLEKLVLDSFIHDECGPTEIANRCNAEIEHRMVNLHDEYPYKKINPANISNYLSKIRDRITKMKQDAFEQITAGVGVIDKLKHLNALIFSAYERRQMIQNQMIESFEKGDKKYFFQAVTADKDNDKHLAEVMKAVSVLEGKLSTYVTIDFVIQIVQKIIDKIGTTESIDFMEREKLILAIYNLVNLEGVKNQSVSLNELENDF